jgi:hypothetical protein
MVLRNIIIRIPHRPLSDFFEIPLLRGASLLLGGDSMKKTCCWNCKHYTKCVRIQGKYICAKCITRKINKKIREIEILKRKIKLLGSKYEEYNKN